MRFCNKILQQWTHDLIYINILLPIQPKRLQTNNFISKKQKKTKKQNKTKKLIATLFAFHLLQSTVEKYLSPTLTKISESLGCSQTLAGVTLLALGNGAPDVFTAIIAGASSETGGI